jgi:hypothetical protein
MHNLDRVKSSDGTMARGLKNKPGLLQDISEKEKGDGGNFSKAFLKPTIIITGVGAVTEVESLLTIKPTPC